MGNEDDRHLLQLSFLQPKKAKQMQLEMRIFFTSLGKSEQ